MLSSISCICKYKSLLPRALELVQGRCACKASTNTGPPKRPLELCGINTKTIIPSRCSIIPPVKAVFESRVPRYSVCRPIKVELVCDRAENECCEMPFRHDALYLKIPDKATTQQYTRTWIECSKLRVKKKVCIQPCIPPEICRRSRRPKLSLLPILYDETALGLMKCKDKYKLENCHRLILPGCGLARYPAKCRTKNLPKICCQKRCTPYPAFSECFKDRPAPKKRAECECWLLGTKKTDPWA